MQGFIRVNSKTISVLLDNEDYEITDFKITESEEISDNDHGHVIAKHSEIVVNLKSKSRNKKGYLAAVVVTVGMGAIGFANDIVGFISDVLPVLTGLM